MNMLLAKCQRASDFILLDEKYTHWHIFINELICQCCFLSWFLDYLPFTKHYCRNFSWFLAMPAILVCFQYGNRVDTYHRSWPWWRCIDADRIFVYFFSSLLVITAGGFEFAGGFYECCVWRGAFLGYDYATRFGSMRMATFSFTSLTW